MKSVLISIRPKWVEKIVKGEKTIEVIDFIEDKKLNFHRGNAVKYIVRAGKKNIANEVEDLKKAAWYINREIERLKNEDCEEFLKNFEEEKNNG